MNVGDSQNDEHGTSALEASPDERREQNCASIKMIESSPAFGTKGLADRKLTEPCPNLAPNTIEYVPQVPLVNN